MITLERFAYTPEGTFGKLTINNWHCFTVERPWDDNKAFLSCIPEGQYVLKKTVTPKHGNTFVLISTLLDVHEHEQETGRYAILIHTGNTMDDVVGCIAPGKSLGWVKSKNGTTPRWAVTHSGDTMKEIRERIVDNFNDFEITQYII